MLTKYFLNKCFEHLFSKSHIPLKWHLILCKKVFSNLISHLSCFICSRAIKLPSTCSRHQLKVIIQCLSNSRSICSSTYKIMKNSYSFDQFCTVFLILLYRALKEMETSSHDSKCRFNYSLACDSLKEVLKDQLCFVTKQVESHIDN